MKKIGRYVVKEKVNSHSYGDTFLAKDEKIGRLVIIKTLSFERFNNKVEQEKEQRKFLREIRVAGKLIHPNIITIYDVIRTEDKFYVAMEYVEGESLEKFLLFHSPIPVNTVIEIVLQLAKALEFAHNHHTIHQHLTPASIFISSSGEAKLSDFGLAHYSEAEHVTRAGKTVGTPSYMAPEQVLGRVADNRTDIYSLGVIFYQMITGSKPFSGKSVSSIFHKILHSPPSPSTDRNVRLDKLPDQLLNTIQKSMEREADKRFQTITELINNLAETAKIINLMEENTSVSELDSSILNTTNSEVSIKASNEKEKVVTFPKNIPQKKKKIKTVPLPQKSDKLSKKYSSIDDKFVGVQETVAREMSEIEANGVNLGHFKPNSTIVPNETTKKQHSRNEALWLLSFFLVSILFIIAVFYVFWGDATQFLRFRNTQKLPISKTISNSSNKNQNNPNSYSSYDRAAVKLDISSFPSKAEIFINGSYVGETPFSDDILQPGKTLLELQKKGFLSWQRELDVKKDNPVSFKIHLTGEYTINIKSFPSKAKIKIDGISFGLTPKDIISLKPGKHLLSLKKTNYQNYKETFVFSDEETRKTISINLKKIKVGNVKILSDKGVVVKLDGYYKGKAPILLKNISIGKHIILLKKRGKSPYKTSITIKKDKEIILKKYFYKLGTIRISATPYGTAYLDSKKIGITPITIQNVRKGHHTIKVVKEGYKVATKKVKVRPASLESVFIVLKRK